MKHSRISSYSDRGEWLCGEKRN